MNMLINQWNSQKTNQKLKKHILTIGTKISLIDIGYNQAFLDNPTIPSSEEKDFAFETHFLREQFSLNLGVAF